MALTLKEALENEDTLFRLQRSPETFRFQNDVSLVVATKHSPPSMFLTDDGRGGLDGFGPLANFLEILAKSMNFTYRLVLAPDKSFGGELPNGSWTGLVGMITREEADFALATVCRTTSRSRVVDYTWPILLTSGKLLVARGSPQIDPWGFVMPLAPMVWLGLCLSLLGVWILMLLVMRKPNWICYHDWIIQNLLNIFKAAVSQDVRFGSHDLKKRSLFGSWICLVAIVSWSYSCSLVALLATRHIGEPIQTLRDLVDNPSVTLITEERAVFANIIDKSTSGIMKEVSNLRNYGRLLYTPYSKIPSLVDNLVRRGRYTLLLTGGRVSKLIADDFSRTGRCDFYIAEESIVPFACGIIAEKSNPIIAAINYRLGILQSSGLYELWKGRYTPNSTSCMNAPTKITVQEAFSLNSIWGMLVVLLSGLLLAIMTFLLELIV